MTNKKLLGVILAIYGFTGILACVMDFISCGIGVRLNICLSAILGVIFLVVGFSLIRTLHRKNYFDNQNKSSYSNL